MWRQADNRTNRLLALISLLDVLVCDESATHFYFCCLSTIESMSEDSSEEYDIKVIMFYIIT